MKVEVHRQSDNGTQTLGELLVINESDAVVFKCDSLELPWKENHNQISCIPIGVYLCIKIAVSHNIPYPHISITNVPNRSGVCIHKGNFHTQILGCIIVGDSKVDINGDGQLDVVNSGKTFEKLMNILPEEFKLTIK